jgi:nucleoside-diphosphate-sugar epimerase
MKLKILITGSNGFLGKNFLSLYKKKYDLYFCNSNQIKNNILFYNQKKKCKLKKFDGVIDFAWKGVNEKKRNSKIQYLNIIDTKKLVKFLKKKNLLFFISIGSQAEYKPTNKVISENSITKPKTNYGIAKLKKFKFLKDFCKKNKIRFVWFRLFSSFGPYDNNYKLITYINKLFIKKKAPDVTSGEQNWNLLYVEDVCSAIKNAVENKKYHGVINLAHNKNYKLKNIIIKASKIAKYNGAINFGGKKYKKDEVWNIKANTKKIMSLGWKPKYTLTDGLIKTYKFLKAN